MPDAFVWYHADASRKEDILHWLDSLSASLDLQVRLYRRTAHGQTTYMEVYEHIEPETLAEIERLAARRSIFANIQRHAEVFDRLASLDCSSDTKLHNPNA